MFQDRADAGKRLAEKLAHLNDKKPVVLALPRGGVPVAHEIAGRLAAPLDVFLVRKLGVPGHPELAMGAIASGGVRVLSEENREMPAGQIGSIAIRLPMPPGCLPTAMLR